MTSHLLAAFSEGARESDICGGAARLRRSQYANLGCFFTWGSGLGQKTPPPLVRDAYSVGWGGRVRAARLRSNLKLVICKVEYDASAQQDLLLFMDGFLMTGAVANKVVTEASDAPSADGTSRVKASCAAANPPSATEENANNKAESAVKQLLTSRQMRGNSTKIDVDKADL
jgi:hypothetical protein